MTRIIVAVVMLLLTIFPSAAQDRFNCEDFETPARAQRILDRDPTDPNQLDANNNGEACEEYFAGLNVPPAEPTPEPETPPADPPAEETPPEPTPVPEETVPEDRFDCEDFTSQARPQRILERDPTDPHGLDANQDGQACEEFFATAETPEAPAEPPADLPAAEPPPEVAPAALPEVTLEDIDCIAFTYQQEAQVILDQDPSDPHNLDPSGDGFACTSLPSRVSVTQLPATGTGTMAAILAAEQTPLSSIGDMTSTTGTER